VDRKFNGKFNGKFKENLEEISYLSPLELLFDIKFGSKLILDSFFQLFLKPKIQEVLQFSQVRILFYLLLYKNLNFFSK
jgi:hypothetical protein